MKDGWRMFGAGAFGGMIGFVVAALAHQAIEDDADRVERVIDSQFRHWRREIKDAQREAS